MLYDYNNSYPMLKIYSDVYYANAKDRRSHSGIVHTLNQSPIMWSSSKLKVLSLSTCEAEYISASSTTQQTHWLCIFLCGMHFPTKTSTTLFVDNKSVVLVSKNSAPTKRRNYIEVRHHYLHQHAAEGRIVVRHLLSVGMLADLFTNPLPTPYLSNSSRNST